MYLKREEGAAAVEFALVVPILLVLVFGIIEFGLIMYFQGVVSTASREGARYGITVSRPDNVVSHTQSYIDGFMSGALVNPTIPVDTSTAIAGDNLTVTVTYDYHFIVFHNILKLLGNSTWGAVYPITGTTTMRFE